MKSNSAKVFVLNIVLKSLLTATLVASASTASAATLFQDDFSRTSSNTVGNGWSELEANNGDVAITGNNRLRLRDNLTGSPDAAASTSLIDATGYENIVVTFDWRSLNNNEANDDLHLSYALDPLPAMTDEASWTQVFEDSDAGTTVFSESISLTALADSEFSLMFWTTVSGGNGGNTEGFWVDNIVVTGDLIPVPLPAGAPLLLLGLGGFAALRRRK